MPYPTNLFTPEPTMSLYITLTPHTSPNPTGMYCDARVVNNAKTTNKIGQI